MKSNLLTLCLLAASLSAAAAKPDEVLNFSLLDYHGVNHEFRRADARFLVLFFTGSDCPIARQTGPKLQAISDEFASKGVLVWLVNSTPQNDPGPAKLDAMYALGRYAPKKMLGDRYAVNGLRDLLPASALGDTETLRRETLQYVWGPPPLPTVLRDEHQLVSQYFNVQRTCETIVIDTKTSTIVYRGAVDDQFTEGARKPAATKTYLHDALIELLANKPVTLASTKAHGCAITYDGPRAQDVAYARDVAPILQAKCVVCHSPGNIGPFAMTSYQKVKGWSAMIHETLLDRRMPPWHADPHYGKFANDRSLTAVQAQTLTRWIEAGSPRGDGDDPLAAANASPNPEQDDAPAHISWTLGQPDFIVRIPEQQIPATGTVDYRYIDSDFKAPQDMWLRAAVTRPGNAKVVHHIIVRMRQPSSLLTTAKPSESFLFTTWVPGLEQEQVPADTGLFVPKGASFNFEIHYTTDGQPHTDQSEVGLYLAKAPAKMLLEVRAAHTRELDIPAGQAQAVHTVLYPFKRDSIVYALSPHMHLRGSWFKFELLQPDGQRETLLSVPNYDFNWQTSYRLATPRRVPAGAWILCTGAFDNSAKNPNNPDPNRRVTWGLQSANEMFMGFIDLAEIPDANSPAAARASAAEPSK
jgi:hypothetical protein